MCDPIKWRQKGEHRNRRHLCRSREPFYSSQPRETPVAQQPPGMAASPERHQGQGQGQSFPTVPAQGDKSKWPTKTPVAVSSKAQPLCTTLNKSQPVENRITSAGWLSKPPGYLKDYAWLHLMIAGDSWKIGFFLFFFLLRHWTRCLLKQLTLFVQNVLRSVLWLMLLGFH